MAAKSSRPVSSAQLASTERAPVRRHGDVVVGADERARPAPHVRLVLGQPQETRAGGLLRDGRAGALEDVACRRAAGAAPRPPRTERASFCWIDQRSGSPCSSSGMVHGTMPVTPTPATSTSRRRSSRVVAQTLAHHSAGVFLGPAGMERVQLVGPLGLGDDAPLGVEQQRLGAGGADVDAEQHAHARAAWTESRPAALMKRRDAVGVDLVPGVAVALEVGADDDAVGLLQERGHVGGLGARVGDHRHRARRAPP